jgi:hypothetical protein
MPGAVFSSADSCSSTVPKTSCVTPRDPPAGHPRRLFFGTLRFLLSTIDPLRTRPASMSTVKPGPIAIGNTYGAY